MDFLPQKLISGYTPAGMMVQNSIKKITHAILLCGYRKAGICSWFLKKQVLMVVYTEKSRPKA